MLINFQYFLPYPSPQILPIPSNPFFLPPSLRPSRSHPWILQWLLLASWLLALAFANPSSVKAFLIHISGRVTSHPVPYRKSPSLSLTQNPSCSGVCPPGKPTFPYAPYTVPSGWMPFLHHNSINPSSSWKFPYLLSHLFREVFQNSAPRASHAAQYYDIYLLIRLLCWTMNPWGQGPYLRHLCPTALHLALSRDSLSACWRNELIGGHFTNSEILAYEWHTGSHHSGLHSRHNHPRAHCCSSCMRSL